MAVDVALMHLGAAGKLRASRVMLVDALFKEIDQASKLRPINFVVPAKKHRSDSSS
ncbi:MAG TPA: hypothetical protein VHS96_00490 [Bacteroidia bacterium]|nr:hypothetical protein [Bacteroidia bacterium]